MPFKNRAQMRAMFAKGGKSAATAKQWVKNTAYQEDASKAGARAEAKATHDLIP